MKTFFKVIPFFLSIFLLGLAACSTGGETATLNINLGKDSLPGKASVSIDQLRHAITLSGPTGKRSYSISGGGTVRATVAAGLWYIDVEAFLGSELYAKGSGSAEVRTGRNTSVTIYMTVVWGEETTGGVGGSGGGKPPLVPDLYASDWEDLYNKIAAILPSPILPAKETVIELNGTTYEAGLLQSTINIPGYVAVTLVTPVNQPKTITRDTGGGGFTAEMFNVNGNGTLILGHPNYPENSILTLEGNSSSNTSLVVVAGSGVNLAVLNMYSNVTLEKNSTSSGTGGAVYINSSGVFTMYGGTIRGNTASIYGGGVYNAGRFEMKGGTIGGIGTDGNTALGTNTSPPQGGGGVYSGGIFLMSGGEIKGNNAVHGGGVLVAGGTFQMDGGTIGPTNTATYDGGGVYVSAAFTMNSGDIIINQANRGGGVYVGAGGSLAMSGGTIGGVANGNTANGAPASGGGVAVISSAATASLTMSGNAKIIGNTASSSNNAAGGGVYVGNNSTFTTMSDNAKINDNTVEGDDVEGGGLYRDPSSTGDFTMSDNAEINGNKAIANSSYAYGGGVFFTVGSSNTFEIKDNAKINGNQLMGGAGIDGKGGGVYFRTSNFLMNGGFINGNKVTTATGHGGGIYFDQYPTSFNKNSGEIDGLGAADGNQVSPTIPPGKEGHAIYADIASPPSFGKNNTSPSSQTITNSMFNATDSVWEFNDP